MRCVSRGPGCRACRRARPVIVCSNHPSWWDPAFFILLQTRLFAGRTGFGPMDAAGAREIRGARAHGRVRDRAGHAREGPRGSCDQLARSRRPSPRAVDHGAGRIRRPADPAGAAAARHRPSAPARAGRGRAAAGDGVQLLERGQAGGAGPVRRPIAAGRERSVAEWTALLEAELARTMDELAAESQSRNPRLFQP